ncbi:tetratricopeptide repeat protein [Hyalangium rubrum]|uniref:Tetratricopeptide repeat protein n=1 Tax=Hyalangium rubrum TaxID=3103134 RepID=A0ABU5GZZ7_9BACT|nr:tetratricopeptide repeat protein [Hyalangium sp. s54d21]MDY7226725.1 tetratricopeptide repeat protein [Hyalangium sp. s54d21]
MGTLSATPTMLLAKSVRFFTLEPPPPGTPPRVVVVENTHTEKRTEFKVPRTAVASLKEAFTVSKLDAATTYQLSLSSEGRYAWMRQENRMADEIKTIVCVKRLPSKKASAVQAAEPRYVLLREGTPQSLSGISALACGFVDDSPKDNVGSLVLRVIPSGQDPSSFTTPPSPDDAPPKSAFQESPAEMYHQGKLLTAAKQFDEALQIGQQCVQQAPRFAECHLLLGASYIRLGHPEEGASAYRKFLELAPDHSIAPKIRQTLEDFDKSKAP